VQIRRRAGGMVFGGAAAIWLSVAPFAVADVQGLDQASATAPVASPAAAAATPVPALSPMDVHPRTSLTIVEQLRHNHYLQKPLDDSASSATFDKYLEALDSARVYLLASDVQALEKYRYTLDDALKRGDLTPAFDVFNRYQARLVERLEFLLAELDKGLERMDFTLDDAIEVEREDMPWPATRAELDDIWAKRLKAAVLGMKLNGKPLPEIQELLVKRYKNRLKQATQTNAEDAFQLYVNAYASTYDPHTQYFSPRTSENFNINMSLSLEGIGAVLRTEDEYTEVVRLVTAGPAENSGQVKPADRIVGVGQGDTGKIIDVVGWRLDDVVELIRGPKDSVVRLEIVPAKGDDADRKIVSIVRKTVELEDQSAQKRLLTYETSGVTRKIGVVEIPTFYADFQAAQQGLENYKSTTRDVRMLIDQLKAEGIEGLVIDLRDNGGGSLQEADALTGLFIRSGPTVQVKQARRRANVFGDTDEDIVWDGPLAVVVNRLSASASEIFAGAIQDYGRGIIIGGQTFGKGTVQTLIPLNRGQLKITQAKFYRISGQSTQHQGVIPDIAIPEIYDVDTIGESALEDALPWDVIEPVVYPHSNQIPAVLANLKAQHQARAVKDPDFQYLNALAAKGKEAREKNTVSLNEAVRRKEKADDDAWRLQLENQLRASKGEPLLASVDELDAEFEDEEAAVEEAAADDATEEDEDDAVLTESGRILVDFIGLTHQVASVSMPKSTAVQ
jgi:carboxyl-terminal processing protease